MFNIGAQVPRKFDIEVARGEINGYESMQIAGSNPAIGKTFEDAWDAGGIFSYPTAGETWEVVSSDANDTLLGTGAQKVLISGLDTGYMERIEEVELSGATPKVTSRTDWFRIASVFVVSSGSGQTNAGEITIRVSGGGLTRSLIQIGLARTFNGFFTVPASKTFIVQQAIVRIPKNEDVTLRTNFFAVPTNTGSTGGDVPIYQSQVISTFTSLPAVPEKTDFRISVKSSNDSVSVALIIEGILANGTEQSNALLSM